MKQLISIIILVLLWCLPISAYEIGNNVYLNACGADPQEYYDKPLNIQNIVTEVPNRITKLEKSKYDREFQTLATSTTNLGNDKINISISNFRDLTIKNNNGDVLTTRKISGASSLYEVKHKGKVVAWGAGWHKLCGEIWPTDFTALRIFLPVKKDNKIVIEEKVISLNLSQTYKATMNSDNLILSDAVTVHGSANASNMYYAGQKFYQLDHINGFRSIDSYVELHEKIDVLQLSPRRTINLLAGFYETEILNKYTKANFDNIYKGLLANYRMDLHHEFDDEYLEKSISDLNFSDEIKKALIAVKNRELLLEDFPPVDQEIPNLKKNCFKQETYDSLKELVRNCYFFHSSYLFDYTFWDGKWFATQTEFKDSKDLLNADKDKRFERFLDNTIWNIKSFNWDEGTVLDELLSIFERANGGYTISKDKKYVVISGCEYKNCTKKGLVFIETEIDTDKLGSTIALIRHLDYQPDKSDARSQSDDWLILSTEYQRYKDLPKEFFDAVTAWRLNGGQVSGDDPLPMPRIIRYFGGYSKEMQVLYNSDDYEERNDREGWLGIRIKQVDKDNNSVVVIDTVTDDGPAYAAGVKSGDIILSMNNVITITMDEFLYQLSKLKADQIVDFKVVRGGKRIDLNVKLGAR